MNHELVSWRDDHTKTFERLILRAVLRKASTMMIRVLAVPDYRVLSSFEEVFRAVLDWDGLGFSFYIHCQEFTSSLRRTGAQWKTLRDFQLQPPETLLYTCGGIDLGNGRSGFSTLKREATEKRLRLRRLMLRLRANLRSKAASATLGANEIVGDARKPASRVSVRRGRRRPAGTVVSLSEQRTCDRLVSPHHGRYCSREPRCRRKAGPRPGSRPRIRWRASSTSYGTAILRKAPSA